MTMSRAKLLVLVAFSIPIAIELRTVFGFFGIELPVTAVIGFEAILLAAIAIVYLRSSKSKTTPTEH